MEFFLPIIILAFILLGGVIEKSKSFTTIIRSQSAKKTLFIYAVAGSVVGLIVHLNIVFYKYNITVDNIYYFLGMFSIFIATHYAFPELRPKDIWEYWERSLNPGLEYKFAFQHSPIWLKIVFNISSAYTILIFAMHIMSKEKTENINIGLSSFWITWFIAFAAMLYPSNKSWKREN